MRIVLFYHSLVSDWNHGNAHFLRGIASELIRRGHDVAIYEPRDAWSVRNLVAEHGEGPLREFAETYPFLKSTRYDSAGFDAAAALRGANLVIVHEWNDHALVRAIGDYRRREGKFSLLFHDTHHRAVTAPQTMEAYDLAHYDGVLAYGNVLRDLYLAKGWARRAWTWHEAADTSVFYPRASHLKDGDVIWIGNWGDDERTAELEEFLIRPVQELQLNARIYGVGYPEHAKRRLGVAGIDYAGWMPNYLAPEAFARFRVTVHVPRRPYVEALPGIPTIRPFEALACGIPLTSAPWPDVESLFSAGADYLVAHDGAEMQRHLTTLLRDPTKGEELARQGLQTIRSRHTCAHRVDELLGIHEEIRGVS